MLEQPAEKAGKLGFILRQAQDEDFRQAQDEAECFQRVILMVVTAALMVSLSNHGQHTFSASC
jgi:hypothetical protein